jgi:hypothetical protein
MTPKDKAKELVETFKKQVSMTIKDYSLVCKVLDNDMAKQCALIAVDELIREENIYNNGSFHQSNYWKQVKQEIEKL